MEKLGLPSENPFVVRMIEIVVLGLQTIFEGRDWSRAFADVGAVGAQALVARTLEIAPSWDNVPPTSRERPQVQDIELCLPKRSRITTATHDTCMPPRTIHDEHMEIG